MRRLAQPQVVKHAAIAAALSAALTLPRMLLWDKRVLPLWYVEAIVFFGGFVLWAFVFAWHTEYTRRPVFTLKIKPSLFLGATVAGLLAAIALHFWLDPLIRRAAPEDFPADIQHWVASTLFALAFTQLFLVYAPFAWLIRLFRNEQIATWLTVALGITVLLLRNQSLPTQLPFSLLVESMGLRIAVAYFAIWFYLRGGILLVWWLGFLIETRHLLSLGVL